MHIDGAELVFVRRDGADEEFVAFSSAFWSIENVDADGRVTWTWPMSQLPQVPRLDSREFVLAALGGALEVRGVSCPGCGAEPYRPTGRSNVFPKVDSRCQRCSLTLSDAVERALSPKARARADRQRVAQFAAASAASAAVTQQAAVRDYFPLTDQRLPELDLEDAVAVLTVEQAASRGVVGPFESLSLAPPGPHRGGASPVASLFAAGVLRVHPESSPSAFKWTDDLPTHLASWAAPMFVVTGSGSATERLADAVTAAHDRVASLVTEDLDDVRRLLLEAVAGETVRYLDGQLHAHRLPALSEANVAAVTTQVLARGGALPLGRLHNVAWSAARTAVTASRRNPMPRTSATTAAANAFVKGVDRALSDGLYERVFDEGEDLPLTPWTSVLFRVLGGSSPMTDAVDDVVAELQERVQPPACTDPSGWRERLDAFEASDARPDAAAARAIVTQVATQGVVWPCGGSCTRHRWIDWVAARALAVDDVLADAGVGDEVRVPALLRALLVGRLDADVASVIDMVIEASGDAAESQ